MTRYIVFDNKGIIHESDSFVEATDEFDSTEDFEGDLIFCEELDRKR